VGVFLFHKKTQFEKNLNTIILYNTNQKLNRKDANGMIEVKNLVKKYGNQFAVNDISFTVEEGKIYGLLGPNGAGKSTCMNIMTGYIAASSGEVIINGHDIMTEAEEAKKYIGYLPEIPPLYPDMTVVEYLNFVAELKKVPKAERAQEIEDVMTKTFITDMKNKLIKHLSKGYKQRVGLAQAMLSNPSVIILDEPMVGLDPKQILEIRELIHGLKKDHTVILSSHILSEVNAVCDEIMIISKGKMIACDTPQGLSHMMQGDTTLELDVKGEAEILKALLSSMEEISSYEVSEKEGGIAHADIHVANTVEIRDALFGMLACNNMPIYRLEMVTKSLEDIFLELTEEVKA